MTTIRTLPRPVTSNIDATADGIPATRRRPRACVRCGDRPRWADLSLCLTCHDDPETREQLDAAAMTAKAAQDGTHAECGATCPVVAALQRVMLVTTMGWAGGWTVGPVGRAA